MNNYTKKMANPVWDETKGQYIDKSKTSLGSPISN